MMSDYVAPRHSAVMERLRRRIELFRRHHNGCENRYENTALERLELERQQTFALHQRCLQTKAKRSNKHRQPPQSSEQAVQRGPGTVGSNSDLGDGGTPGEQSRNSTLIAVSEHVNILLVVDIIEIHPRLLVSMNESFRDIILEELPLMTL